LVRKKIDTVCRWGGEEFAIIMPETNAEAARIVGERIRETVMGHKFTYKAKDVPVRISVGIASFPLHAKSTGDLTQAADDALYEAKNTGRNKVVVASAPEAA
jgi:diguanylate cyclase (GGDEF)-like protein